MPVTPIQAAAGHVDAAKPLPPGLAARINELLRAGGREPAGRRVTLLSLDAARKHFGADWPRLAPKVQAIVASTLRGLLTEGDVLTHLDELSFALLPGGRWGSEWNDRLAAAADEISGRLCGRGQGRELIGLLHLAGQADGASAPAVLDLQSAECPAEGASALERLVRAADGEQDVFSLDGITCVASPVLALDGLSPVWWACLPVRNEGGACGYGLLPSEADPALHAELDALTAEFAVELLRPEGERGRLVQLPVHRATLSQKKFREMYVKICRSLLAVRRDRLIFDIHGIEDGTPSTRVAEYVQWLRPFCRSLTVTVSPDFAQPAIFGPVGVLSVGADPAGLDPEIGAARLAKFVARVKAANLRSHVHGVESRVQADLCLKLGVDYLAGPLVRDGFS